MRRLVGAAAVAGIFCLQLERAWMDGGVLFPGLALQLSAFHGHGVPGLSLAERIREVPGFYGAHGAAARAGGCGRACLVCGAAVDFYTLHLLEPLAQHG